MPQPYKSVQVSSTVYEGQKPGTSGLRKAVRVFQLPNYTENFVQCILTAIGTTNLKGCSLVVGGDGRYYCEDVIQKIIQIAAANEVGKLIIGQNGILSTPAVSCIIRKYKLTGGIVLTASHNPGGIDHDFGIKYNTENGGPASDATTNHIYNLTKDIKSYSLVPDLTCSVNSLGLQTFQVDGRKFIVEVIDSVNDYLNLMKSIFDFNQIRSLFIPSGSKPPFKSLINSMHGVTGPYVQRIFVEELGAPVSNTLKTTPLKDFGGHHPDPNLTYAADLVNIMKENDYDFGAAFDGDGDRNMILGRKAFFVTPSDSLAVLANNLDCIPYFKKSGIKGFARSMPTAAAVDRVAMMNKKEMFEVPTGWKYFGNLMDANRLSLCGEESFGTGSDHIREKDGIWAVLAWLSVIAHLNKSVEDILRDHWAKYGRNYFARYDYEECPPQGCAQMMSELETQICSPDFKGKTFTSNGKTYIAKSGDNYEYTDPIDNSVTKNQGLRILFEDGSRLIFRLSGTGSVGATVRMYIESYEPPEGDIYLDAQVALKPLIQIGLDISKLPKFTDRDAPTVIT